MDSSTPQNRYLTWRFWRHMLRLQTGLFFFGFSIALMLEARIGLDPWSSFQEGLSNHSGLTFGRISQIVGLLLILASAIALKVRPGIGTVCNMLIIGPWIDLFRSTDWLPRFAGGWPGTGQFVVGLVCMGIATAIYIGAQLGAGPRDGFVMGLSQRIERSLRQTRIGIEVVVLAAAFAIGGAIGWGTLIFAVLMGPIMQASLKVFRVSHDPSPSWQV